MTAEQRQRLDVLCSQIKEEKDHHRLLKLVQDLNDLLGEEDKPGVRSPATLDTATQ